MRKIGRFWTCWIILAVIVSTVFMCGYSAQVELGHDWKGKITLELVSESSDSDFRKSLDSIVAGYNEDSGDNDMVNVQTVEPIEKGYRVTVTFRRIDKIKGMGDFEITEAKLFVREGSDTLRTLEKWAKGNISGETAVRYNGRAGTVFLPGTNRLSIRPVSPDNEEIAIEEFTKLMQTTSERNKIFCFKLLDFRYVTGISISFPGKIRYVAGNAISLIDENSVQILPTEVDAEVSKYEKQVQADGSERLIYVENKLERIDAMLGYVVFEQGISPTALIFIGIGAAIVLLLLIYGLYRVYKLGKSANAQLEE